VVKNTKEWLESRKKLKERKKREAGDSRASDEPAALGFPIGGIKEQVAQLRNASRTESEGRARCHWEGRRGQQ
jgi:hypothetical protein